MVWETQIHPSALLVTRLIDPSGSWGRARRAVEADDRTAASHDGVRLARLPGREWARRWHDRM